MTSEFEPVIGLEVHAELQTNSKMFCACPVVDSTQAQPNTAVCPICSGMPGVLPVVNRRAVEYALRVALALECEVATTSVFARKNYFYPDLPKGYQISQYEQPLAQCGRLTIVTKQGERVIRIRRVHLEEDAGKLTHVHEDGDNYSLVDLNRAGIPLLEIVSEPDLHSAEEVRAFATGLRDLLRYLGVNSGEMQKGVMRIEPNVSVRRSGNLDYQTRSEIKNLNSFRSLERSVDYEIGRQIKQLQDGLPMVQQTLGWDEVTEMTVPQRSKEEAHDYRYFPEPDLPPLVIEPEFIEQVRAGLPELPVAKYHRFLDQYGLKTSEVEVLVGDRAIADFFEQTVGDTPHVAPTITANWIMGELFGLLNQAGQSIEMSQVKPHALAALIEMVESGGINQNTGKSVMAEMFRTGKSAKEIVTEQGLAQISDIEVIASLVEQVLHENPEQVKLYLEGKEALSRWFFGQVMRAAQGRANPKIVQDLLDQHLGALGRSE
jgi:aspartyl-tRNA(Asn)/glutamyl-tRNA(Gln) amidotransferase subunit B